MAIQRTITMPEGAWAQDAEEPAYPPVPGTPYRNTDIDLDEWHGGQKFAEIIDSSKWNALFYRLTGLLSAAEKTGVLIWSPLTNYPVGAIVIGLDDKVYQATSASGPDNGGAIEAPGNAWIRLVTMNEITVSSGPFLGSELLFSQTGAGSYSFVCPDRNNGQEYEVIIYGKAAGGSGAGGANGDYRSGGGGCEGETLYHRVKVTPGMTITGNIGNGGAPVSGTASPGNNGGNTTITIGATTLTLEGGLGGAFWTGTNQTQGDGGGTESYATNTVRLKGERGGQPSDTGEDAPTNMGGNGAGRLGGVGARGSLTGGQSPAPAGVGTHGCGGGGAAGQSSSSGAGGSGFIFIWLR